MNPTEVYERLTNEGSEWADKHAAAELLEATLKSVHSQCVIQYRSKGKPISECENLATINPDYINARRIAIEARQEANRAKVRYKSAEAWFDAMRTAEATHRAASKAAPM